MSIKFHEFETGHAEWFIGFNEEDDDFESARELSLSKEQNDLR